MRSATGATKIGHESLSKASRKDPRGPQSQKTIPTRSPKGPQKASEKLPKSSFGGIPAQRWGPRGPEGHSREPPEAKIEPKWSKSSIKLDAKTRERRTSLRTAPRWERSAGTP